MKASARPLSIATIIACLSLGACREQPQEKEASDPNAAPPEAGASPKSTSVHEEQASSRESAATRQEITDLKRKIVSREQVIGDLEAAVVMERPKLVENPDYDQSFLSEVLHEQEQERLEIERARKRIEALTGSGE